MVRQTAEGGKWNRTVRTRGVVRGVTPRQDGIGCYATGHQSYLYTGPLVPLFPPQAPLPLIRTDRLETKLWNVHVHQGSTDYFWAEVWLQKGFALLEFHKKCVYTLVARAFREYLADLALCLCILWNSWQTAEEMTQINAAALEILFHSFQKEMPILPIMQQTSCYSWYNPDSQLIWDESAEVCHF